MTEQVPDSITEQYVTGLEKRLRVIRKAVETFDEEVDSVELVDFDVMETLVNTILKLTNPRTLGEDITE